MKIAYYIRHTGLSGGVKVMLQHVSLLKAAGYDALLVTKIIDHQWTMEKAPEITRIGGMAEMPACDIYVGTNASDVYELHTGLKGIVVHLCQGYEPTDYEARLRGEAVTDRYRRRGWCGRFRTWRDKAKFRRRIRGFERVYALPTVKAAVSKHLAALVAGRYGQPCALIRNGIDVAVFHPDTTRVWGGAKIRLLSVGSAHVGFKGIPDTLEAVRMLKGRGVPVELVRVSPTDPGEEEGRVVDVFLKGLAEGQMAELYRGSDIFISSSLEGEGFGLPAVEAFASGVPAILTDISSYRNMGDARDFACFVPQHSPGLIAEGVMRFIADSAFRERCVREGLKVAANFTLEGTRTDLVSFFDTLSKGRKGHS
ncbi:MAG: glycosyltransferase family 4 protein [Syntrophorhabdales bacterium]|jgi:glycosyltransferase involved in cell wall biosynthesis